jgi:alanine dehydrogenase
MKTKLLSQSDVRQTINMSEIIVAIEQAFGAYAEGRVQMPPKSYVDLEEYNGDFRSMPSYINAGEWDAAGIKWVNVHPDNPDEFGLPTVMGTLIYSEPQSGYPLAIMDGTELTMKRTGAAAAVATDYLSIDNADSLGIIGAGVQSYSQVEAITEVRPIEDIVVSDVNETSITKFMETFGDRYTITEGSVSEAGHCDILSTVTPVENPLVKLDDVGEHTHINAMGADARGKQELSDKVHQASKLVIDDYEQCTHSGEINRPWAEGILTDEDIYAEIGDIVTGEKEGRTPADELTIFDSTGLAIQDVAAAHVVYQRAGRENIGSDVALIGSN